MEQRKIREGEQRLALLRQDQEHCHADAERRRREAAEAEADTRKARDALDLHRDAKPGIWQNVATFGAAGHEWRETYQPLLEGWRAADAAGSALADGM
ncbi:hypothetical protein, partial [Micrococcus sp. F3Y]|uniref:hypothetical protein n=1 Tax=Micrococcus sp. F3Y TaxID=3402627 RepID=UPI003AF77EE2